MTALRPMVLRTTPLLLLLALVTLSTVLGSLGGESIDRVVVGALINLVIVVGLYSFTGLTGVFSFGHLGFVAIGAYVVAVLTVPADLKEVLFRDMASSVQGAETSFALAVVLGGLVAAAVAAVLALPLSRMAGLTAGLATIAILVTAVALASNWKSVTNGVQGISAIPTNTTTVVALVTALLVIVLVWVFQESSMGLKIKATREDPIAARAMGIRVGWVRGVALVFSAFIVGIGGGLYAQLQGNVAPSAFYLAPTFLILAMLLIGGVGSLAGAVVGAILISALREFLRRIEAGIDVGPVSFPGRPGLMEVGLALSMLLIMILRPSGLMGGRELSIDALAHAGRWIRHPFGNRAPGPNHPAADEQGGPA